MTYNIIMIILEIVVGVFIGLSLGKVLVDWYGGGNPFPRYLVWAGRTWRLFLFNFIQWPIIWCYRMIFGYGGRDG